MVRAATLLAGFIVLLLGSVVARAPGSTAQPPAASVAMGTAVVVHGVEGFPADVYLDGSPTPALAGFEFRRVTDPLAMPVGVHRADLRRAGEPASATPTLSGTFEIRPNERITIAALLDPAGKPTWLAFPNDAAITDATRGEIRFRHFAASGPVNLALNGRPARQAVPNMATASQVAPLVLEPGRHRLAVTDAQSGATVAPMQEVALAAGSATNVYLTGRAPGPLGLLQQAPTTPAVAVLNTQVPTVVAGGDSGLADPAYAARGRGGAGPGEASLLVAGTGAAVVGWFGLWARARRRGLRG